MSLAATPTGANPRHRVPNFEVLTRLPYTQESRRSFLLSIAVLAPLTMSLDRDVVADNRYDFEPLKKDIEDMILADRDFVSLYMCCIGVHLLPSPET